MPTSRIVALAPLDELVPVFEEIRRAAGVKERYNDAVQTEARDGGHEVDPPHVPGVRIDAEHLPLVTVDPEGSRDLDQAVAIERVDGRFRVHYAIADVGAHVVPGGALDLDTRERVETTYCPDRRIGLHPPHMSEGYASLLPGQRTKAVLWTLDLTPDGELAEVQVVRAWVRSRHQYTYAELSDDPPADARDLVAAMREVGDLRRAVTRARGAVSLPKPSQEVSVEDGHLTLEFRAARPLEDDNAQISLLTGMAAARLMLEAGVGVLRTMPPATDAALERLRRQATALDIRWPADQSYSEMLDHLDLEAPRAAAFLVAAVSLFRGASWEPFDASRPSEFPMPEPVTHGALAAPYAHVTAPLRRLVDRYAAEICLAKHGGYPIPAWALESLPWIGKTMAAGVQRGASIETACIAAVEAALLEPHVGEEFEGVGLDRSTVQLKVPAVIARCTGDVKPGELQRVRLVSSSRLEGALFEVVAP